MTEQKRLIGFRVFTVLRGWIDLDYKLRKLHYSSDYKKTKCGRKTSKVNFFTQEKKNVTSDILPPMN